MPRIVVIMLVVVYVALVPQARADVVSPEQEECYDKKPGDACSTCVDGVDNATCGTCVVPPPSCQAGACRRFADQAACLAEPGCSWESGRPVCSGAPCACKKQEAAKTPDAAPAAKTDEKPSSCASGAPVSLGALAVAALLAMVRRRR